MKDGITPGWTDMQNTEVIGLLEVGKLQAVKEYGTSGHPGKIAKHRLFI
jgi:hypothetical protein